MVFSGHLMKPWGCPSHPLQWRRWLAGWVAVQTSHTPAIFFFKFHIPLLFICSHAPADREFIFCTYSCHTFMIFSHVILQKSKTIIDAHLQISVNIFLGNPVDTPLSKNSPVIMFSLENTCICMWINWKDISDTIHQSYKMSITFHEAKPSNKILPPKKSA